jgi:hypothetical protein
MQPESLYRVPKANLQRVEPASRFRVVALVAGLFTIALAYLAVAMAGLLAIGALIHPDRTLDESLLVLQQDVDNGDVNALVSIALGIAAVAGGMVAAKLGRPRYALHAASLGGFLVALYLGGAGLLVLLDLATWQIEALSFALLAATLATTSFGGCLARWHERDASRGR